MLHMHTNLHELIILLLIGTTVHIIDPLKEYISYRPLLTGLWYYYILYKEI